MTRNLLTVKENLLLNCGSPQNAVISIHAILLGKLIKQKHLRSQNYPNINKW